MQYTSSILAASALITSVSAHGFITSPQARLAGDAMKAACGQQVYNNQASDNYGNIQGELQVAASQTDYNAAECNIWQCKGYKYADNTANVQSYTAGQVVDMTFDVRAPHTGYANVSIVNTATNSIIGDMLLVYSDFADNSKTIPANETSFSITIPSDLGDTCSTAGACVIQHYWNAESIDQTYESCIDFTVGGSGSSSGSSSSSAAVVASSTGAAVVASSSAVVATSAPAVSSTAAAVVTSSSAAPTTLQTVVKSSTVAAVSTPARVSSAPAATETATGDDEDDCY
ncbi:related to chitin binding protein [Phialocephala subalpina]|uniref:Related to chitin binding protein n=1 Tax=Phialocephala subalpina TaxID=576137 RepID=A0A1L7XQL6_9HELO|nr:related to chitin binding protein [Phialocephala subalpina]